MTRPASHRATDPSVPSSARMWCCLLEGQGYHPADRSACDALEEVMPGLATLAKWTRSHHDLRVQSAAQRGVRQYLDLGAGLPQPPGRNTHDLASGRGQAVTVYVDHDPQAVSRTRAACQAPGVAVVVADLTVPGLLQHPEITAHLDLRAPVAVLLTGVLECLEDEPASELLTELFSGLPAHSVLEVTTMTALKPRRARLLSAALRSFIPQTGWRLRTGGVLNAVLGPDLAHHVRGHRPVPYGDLGASTVTYAVPPR